MTPTDRLTAEQAAKFLGLSRKTLANQRSAGTGPPSYKIGNRVWYDSRDLEVFIARCKSQTLIGA
ncbi:helix-turn-helix transcriptional regulator [Rhodococcus sp. NPDC078407]|uniref:helix-turn-helix transcriptional regulator n=1 Tax=Rhodococcus sp. NPDC078407 TaxID=3364509 RepID=UPI0037C6914B